MKFQDMVAYKCRYGANALEVFKDYDILWENSEDDYQGHASFLGKKDNDYILYEWSYGSCSGCDEWENLGYSDEQVQDIMRKGTAHFNNIGLEQFCVMLETSFKNTSDYYDTKGKIVAIKKELNLK